MSEENISQELRLKNIDETRNYFIEEINRNEMGKQILTSHFANWEAYFFNC